MFELTPQQAAAIAKRWNTYAKDSHHISAKRAHLVFGDNADWEMETDGCVLVEIGPFASKTGNPHTFYVTSDEVSLCE